MSGKLKMLIVDDETLSRNRLTAFPLEGCNYEIVAEAENGRDAFDKIGLLKPDIVITDIVMPVMDGLQLLEKIHEMANPPKVVMLTCYEDFAKAQKAMRLGAQDYIVKMMLEEEDFKKSIDKVALSIARERQLAGRSLRSSLEKLLHCRSDKAAGQYLAQLAEMEFSVSNFRLLLLCMTNIAQAVDINALIPEKWEGGFRCAAVETAEDQICLLLYSPDRMPMPAFESMADSFSFELNETIWKVAAACGHRFHMISGIASSGAALLAEAYRSLALGRSRLFYCQPGAVQREACLNRPFTAFPDDEFHKYAERFRESAANLDGKGAADCLCRWMKDAAARYRPPPEEVRGMLQTLASSIPAEYSCADTDGSPRPLHLWLKERAAAAAHMTEIEDAVCRAREALSAFDGVKTYAMRGEIKLALAYIHKNYGSEITLQSAAEHVKLSPSWLRALFRSEVHESFGDYLIRYRIERAKRMLATTGLSIGQISESVGIADPHYFSRIFTKNAGVNPKEFRNAAVCGKEM